jgi:hypothetical protein
MRGYTGKNLYNKALYIVVRKLAWCLGAQRQKNKYTTQYQRADVPRMAALLFSF